MPRVLFLCLLILAPPGAFAQWAPLASGETISSLIADMRADDVPGNAERAVELLSGLSAPGSSQPPWESVIAPYPELETQLRAALDSDDGQQRRFAVRILAARCADATGLSVTPQSLEAFIDNWEPDSERGNAEWSLAALAATKAPADAARLHETVRSGDFQQRFFAARALMHEGDLDAAASEALVANLASDEELDNAMHLLWEALDLTESSPPLSEALARALDSADYQTRQLAGLLLARMPGSDAAASPRLSQVLVEGLQSDEYPFGEYYTHGSENAHAAVGFFLSHPDFATSVLEAALDSRDPQQRFIAAYVLALTGRADRMDRIAALLVPLLRSDDVWNNAILATNALRHAGPAAIPFIEPLLNDADPQARQCAAEILAFLRDPVESDAQRAEAMRLHLGRLGSLCDMMTDWPE